MARNWQNMIATADRIIDAQWAETAVIHPQSQDDEYTALSADPERPVVETEGVFTRPGASVTNTPGGNRAQADYILQIMDDKAPGYELRDEDRVFMSDRNQWFQISYVDTRTQGRVILHLMGFDPR